MGGSRRTKVKAAHDLRRRERPERDSLYLSHSLSIPYSVLFMYALLREPRTCTCTHTHAHAHVHAHVCNRDFLSQTLGAHRTPVSAAGSTPRFSVGSWMVPLVGIEEYRLLYISGCRPDEIEFWTFRLLPPILYIAEVSHQPKHHTRLRAGIKSTSHDGHSHNEPNSHASRPKLARMSW